MIRRIVEKERYKKKCDHVIRSLWTRTAHQNLEEGWLLCDFLSFTTSSFCQLCHHKQLELILRLAASYRYLAGLCFVVNILIITVTLDLLHQNVSQISQGWLSAAVRCVQRAFFSP